MTPDLDLAELRRLSDAATPGPWEAREHAAFWDVYAERDGDWYQVFDVLPDKPNCEFVVAMRNVLPALLPALEQAEAERAQRKETLQIVVTQMLLAFRKRAEVDSERDALRALLQERVEIDMIAIPTEDGPMCGCCGAEWQFDDDTPAIRPGTEWHEPECWVVRVRAALVGTPEETPSTTTGDKSP